MHQARPMFRTAAVSVLLVAVAGASGCSWFRKGDDPYAQSPETRPLEVPPGLDAPNTEGAMKLPAGTVTRSAMATPATGTAGSALGFTVAGERDAIFNRVGEVLAATPGLTIASKAQILGTYDIDFEGSKFLVRITKVDAGTYVSAVDPRGLPASGAAPAKLIATLKASVQ